MARENYLIDTNIAIYYFGMTLSGKSEKFLDKVLSGNYAISVINRIELLGFGNLSRKDAMFSKPLLIMQSSTILMNLLLLKPFRFEKTII